jgi:hypothetical protein
MVCSGTHLNNVRISEKKKNLTWCDEGMLEETYGEDGRVKEKFEDRTHIHHGVLKFFLSLHTDRVVCKAFWFNFFRNLQDNLVLESAL